MEKRTQGRVLALAALLVSMLAAVLLCTQVSAAYADEAYFTIYKQVGDNGAISEVKSYTYEDFVALKDTSGDPVSGQFWKSDQWNVTTATEYVTFDALLADAGIADAWVSGAKVSYGGDPAQGKTKNSFTYDDLATSKFFPDASVTAPFATTNAVSAPLVFALKEATTAVTGAMTCADAETANLLIAGTSNAPRSVLGVTEEVFLTDDEGAPTAAGKRLWSTLPDILVTVPGERVAGDEADETAAEIALAAFPDGCENVVLVRDDDFADALSAAGLAGVLNAPIVLTSRYGLSDAANYAIGELNASNVYIVGGVVAVTEAVETDLEGAGIAWYNIHRVAGLTAADTSVKCAELAISKGGSTSEAIIAMSDNFQDALSISSYAYSLGVSIILLESGATAMDRTLSTKAASLLKEGALAAAEVIVVGGTGAVSDDAVEEVRANFTRIAGYDGYDTSNQIALWALDHGMSADVVCVACGAKECKGLDALAGAALAGQRGGILLLANEQPAFGADALSAIQGGDSEADDSFFESHAAQIDATYVLGGSYVMPDSFAERLLGLLAQASID